MRGRIITLLGTAVLLAAVAASWLTNRAAPPKTPSWDDVAAEAKAGGYRLISTEELRERLDRDPAGVLVVDTRQDWEYRTGHIPGAILFPMEPTALARWKNKGALEAALGPDRQRAIVFY